MNLKADREDLAQRKGILSAVPAPFLEESCQQRVRQLAGEIAQGACQWSPAGTWQVRDGTYPKSNWELYSAAANGRLALLLDSSHHCHAAVLGTGEESTTGVWLASRLLLKRQRLKEVQVNVWLAELSTVVQKVYLVLKKDAQEQLVLEHFLYATVGGADGMCSSLHWPAFKQPLLRQRGQNSSCRDAGGSGRAAHAASGSIGGSPRAESAVKMRAPWLLEGEAAKAEEADGLPRAAHTNSTLVSISDAVDKEYCCT
ncbi:hypothetical protein AOLI_G00229230 [Acnodon oligacanthus]